MTGHDVWMMGIGMSILFGCSLAVVVLLAWIEEREHRREARARGEDNKGTVPVM